ncbi:hypothetical protein WJX73_004992 [Symbiochloris irregularis]|uniref:Uncharacterized protein n=1 Tax=Symbiochloris irregularis TaxID=706552 RepID=A0AAW1PDW5_9CHLO
MWSVSGKGVMPKTESCAASISEKQQPQRTRQFRPTLAASKARAVKRQAGGSTRISSRQSAPKVLTRVEELRLLSKLEQAGLLSALEKRGLTLSYIENAGLLSKAEKFGVLSAAADRSTPVVLYILSVLLIATGGAVVFFTPDETTAQISIQAIAAALALAAGGAAFSGASLLSALQK